MMFCWANTTVATIQMNFIQSCDKLSNKDKCSVLLTKCDICRLVMGQYHSPSGEVISHLNISSVHTRDGGQYSCVATNTVASVRHSARVNIYGDYYEHYYHYKFHVQQRQAQIVIYLTFT